VNSRFRKIKKFLERENFDGFTKKDLFILNFMPNAWGQDIAALSNIAEALRNLSTIDSAIVRRPPPREEISRLLKRAVEFAIHPKVNPWKRSIAEVKNFNHYGYYLEHLNIVLGCYQAVVDDEYSKLNERVTMYLRDESLAQGNAHARLIPHVKMRWCADQSAIIYSLWLFDQNNKTKYHVEPKKRWLEWMREHGTQSETGLFITEAMGVKGYSNQPRGCSHAYMCYYLEHFDYSVGKKQWELFKQHMAVTRLGVPGFREYLPNYKGKWTPDSGPILFGMGVAATGLALKPMRVWGDENQWSAGRLLKLSRAFNELFKLLSFIPFLGRFFLLGSDMLATSIILAAETTQQKYI